MKKISIIRNAKFWGLEFSPEFMVDFNKTISVMNKISSHLRRGLLSGDITKISRYDIYHKDGIREPKDDHGRFYSAADYVREVLDDTDIFDGAREKCQSFKRMFLYYVMERYTSYFKRNGSDKIPTIVIKQNKSLYYKESGFIKVDLENSKLVVTTLYGEIDVPFKYSLKSEHLKKEGKNKEIKVGGNFVIGQNAFVAKVDFEKNVLYDPKSVLSFDLNKTKSDWIVFNDSTKIVPCKDIEKLIDDIRILNTSLDKDKKKPISKRAFRTKERRKIRYNWIEKHKQLNALISIIVNQICEKAIKSKSLLCIDSVTTGQKNGTFGQDHLIKLLVTRCENKGIPFYVVPCANTSRRCSKCGFIKKENRKSTSEFHCQDKDCDYKCDAQENGAKNVAFQGNRLLEANVPYGNWARRKVDKLVEEYSQQESSVVTSEAS